MEYFSDKVLESNKERLFNDNFCLLFLATVHEVRTKTTDRITYSSYSNLVIFQKLDLNFGIDVDLNSGFLKAIETRPLSRSKYSPLPQIGQKLTDAKMNRSTSMTSGLHATNDERDEKSILIGLRLPDGAKKQHTFSSKHKMSQVLEFALETKQPSVINKYTLLLMPNFVVNDPSKTLGFYKIENRSMLFVIEKSLID